ncbi:MAG: hypothetical protein IJV13_07280 [Prevotella sp.]|nr:hypothetical protein [Prevotella sp.]
MRRYIKPITEIYAVTTEHIMQVVSGPKTMDSSEKASDPEEILGKPSSLWDNDSWDEEE